ncbi:hypothetical protein Cgig2_032753 [Carnegiea gigantea]|uniref:GDSL esterase/lipase n=1 Tax=Carnegiea gigantea TaxID=171969 RepID=A0A9Q1KI43_9CARY|nr:hypothetical protein Cgig2_032753 [Carnegiea gigantea]
MSTTLMSLLVYSLLLCHHAAATSATVAATPTRRITALYVFGDSTVDPGNNNYLPSSLFRANHEPYGSNFPGRVPTGRFTDGRLATDYIADSLHLSKFIPAYLDPAHSNRDLLTGVSFASAGSGLDDLTIKITRALDLTGQVRYFEEAVNRVVGLVGKEKANRTVENALFLISVGTNDMAVNYFDLPTRALQFSPSEYSDFLIARLRDIIQWLYKLGGRRFAVVGLPPIGCLPIQVTVGSILNDTHWLQRSCVDHQNEVSQVYNGRLQAALNELQSQYSHARFVYTDIYSPLDDMISHPSSYGFERTLEGCCGTGIVEGSSLCNALTPMCPNASTYVFWDSIHPTQAAYHVIANSIEANVIPKLLS